MVDQLPIGPDAAIAELGPGTGVFTAELLKRLGPDARFLTVEIDPMFAAALSRRWPALDVACAAAETLPALLAARGMTHVDHIVSGLPFVSLPPVVVGRTLAAIAECLRPGGTFTTFQYAHCYMWPSAVSFRRQMGTVLGAGAPWTRLVMPNAPPALALRWRRP